MKVGLVYSGLGPNSNWPRGFSAKIASEMALEKVYEMGVLPEGLDMQLEFIDTQCDANLGKNLIFDALERNEIKVFIGPACSPVAQSGVAFVAHSFFNQSIYQKPFLVTTSYFYNPIDDNESELIRLEIQFEIFCHWLTTLSGIFC